MIALDPITAVANAIAETAKTIGIIVQGQPPEVQAEFWRQYIEDVKWWRKVLKIDVDPQPK